MDRRHAFSLVELLVVIAIISTLAAIMLPTLQEALEMSRRTKCLSNTRELYTAATMYAGEFNDRMPYFDSSYSVYDQDLYYWTNTNAPLRVFLSRYAECPLPLTRLGRWKSRHHIMNCPSRRYPYATSYPAMVTEADRIGRSDSYTWTGFGAANASLASNPGSPRLGAMARGGRMAATAPRLPVALLMEQTSRPTTNYRNRENHDTMGGNVMTASGDARWVDTERWSTNHLYSHYRVAFDYYSIGGNPTTIFGRHSTNPATYASYNDRAAISRLFGY